MKTIYLAGGCFWGAEKYLSLIQGVENTEVGYANGHAGNPTYEDVCRGDTGHAETVKVEFDPVRLSLTFLLEAFYKAIDPTSQNRQGGDVGTQYRTGIYFTDAADEDIILGSVQLLQESLTRPVAIEVKPLSAYWPAEEYHQKYLDKNPGGYCHIPPQMLEKRADKTTLYRQKEKAVLRETLTGIQFEVTQNGATEPPFRNEYHGKFEPGVYVDVTTGEPLFVSADKFDAGCGWPAFSKPIKDSLLLELPDNSWGRKRIEIRSKKGNSHLGHLFADGPEELGGLRYCINSASLRFVPRNRMEEEGYGDLLGIVGG